MKKVSKTSQVMNEVEKIIIGNKNPENDVLLEMAINQGYVSKKCKLPGGLVMALQNSGEDPCAGCNHDRNECEGRKHR